MITAIRVRFASNGNAGTVWSDQLFTNWMQPLRMYSLANFWMLSSHGLFDVSFALHDPIVIADPRPNVPPGGDTRAALIDAAIAEATKTVKPDWDHTDILLLWFAQPTDYFGGGTSWVPLSAGGFKSVAVTVVDIATPFDAACQELGHSFGFQHEVSNRMGRLDYGSDYSVMSARKQLGRFRRAHDDDLPDGINVIDEQARFKGVPAQQIIGPLLAVAQMFRIAAFRDSPRVIQLGGDAPLPATARLYAANYQLTQPPGPLPVLVTFRSKIGDQRTFTLELRRGGYGYEAGLTASQAGVVVHSFDPDGRVRYEGMAGLALADAQVDWPCASGDFSLRLVYVDPAREFVDVMIRPGARRYFPIRGVLLAGGFRTQQQLNLMSHDDMRNTLIVEMTNHSNQTDYQAYDNDALAGVGAVMVFLRRTGIRDDPALSSMSADDQRNTLIVELDAQTGQGLSLQRLSNMDLVLVGLGSDAATRGQAPGVVSSWIRGALLAGGFRTQHQLNSMSHDDMRNTLIVEMTNHSNQTNYQAYNDADLEGVGAVMVTLRELGIRDDAALRSMSADDQRNTLIVELDAQTKRGAQLQGMSNVQLVLTALGVEPA